MINNNSTANKYNTMPHHDFNEHFDGSLLSDINLKMNNVKEKMNEILIGLNQLLVIIYP